MAARKKIGIQAQGASVGHRDKPVGTLFDPKPFNVSRASTGAPSVPTGRLFNPQPYGDTGKVASSSPDDFPTLPKKLGMLPMMVTPREVMGSFTALEGDRESVYGSGSGGYTDSRAGDSTDRTYRTDGVSNNANYATKPYIRRHHEARALESDDEVFARKADESEYRYKHTETKYVNPEGNTTVHSDRVTTVHVGDTVSGYTSGDNDWTSNAKATWSHKTRRSNEQVDIDDPDEGLSLADVVRKRGMPGALHLQVNSPAGIIANKNVVRQHHGMENTSDPTPQVLGGHHRLSVAQIARPDDLVPALYDKDIHAARAHPEVYEYH